MGEPNITSGPDAALAQFMEYFRQNYPGPDTIIHKPDWHSPRIFRAAMDAHRRATPDLRDVVRELVDALVFVLPLAKGYAAQNDHAVNHECIEIARAALAKAKGVL